MTFLSMRKMPAAREMLSWCWFTQIRSVAHCPSLYISSVVCHLTWCLNSSRHLNVSGPSSGLPQHVYWPSSHFWWHSPAGDRGADLQSELSPCLSDWSLTAQQHTTRRAALMSELLLLLFSLCRFAMLTRLSVPGLSAASTTCCSPPARLLSTRLLALL